MMDDQQSGMPDDRGEMRKYPRFQSRRLIRFIKENGDEIKSISKIINVSQGGLQFACRDQIDVDTVLRLDIPDETEGPPVTLKARVIWNNPSPDAHGLYYSGVTFINMEEDARILVLKAIT